MATSLPQRAKNAIGDNEDVVFWCRRAAFEMVEEFSQATFFIVVYSAFILDAARSLNMPSLQFGLLLNVFAVWYATYEFLLWKNEIHIVTEYTHTDSGAYHKLWGVFKLKSKDIPISKTSPDIATEVRINMRLWRWITGESQERVHLSSEGNSYVNSKRMPPAFAKAIKNVRGSPAAKEADAQPEAVRYSKEIRRAWKDGAFSNAEAKRLIRRLWDDAILE